MRNYKQAGDIISVIAPYSVTPGAGVLVGAIFGIAVNRAAQGDPVELLREGVVSVVKPSAESWAQGAPIFWNNSTRIFTTGGGSLVGLASDSYAASVTTGGVLLQSSGGTVSFATSLTGGAEIIDPATGLPMKIGSGVKSWRGLGQGMSVNVQGLNGGVGLWSRTSRTRHYSNAKFRRVRVGLATFWPSGNPIADTNYANDYNFQVGFELDYAAANTGIAPRKMFRFSDSTVAMYRTATPPVDGIIESDVLDLGREVTAKEFFGLWTTVEAAARAGDNLCPFTRNGSNYINKYLGISAAVGVSQIDLGTAETASSIAAVLSTQTGAANYYTPAYLLIEIEDGSVETIILDGASNVRGTGEGGSGSGAYGDACGSELSNLGFMERAINEDLNWNAVSIAIGSDTPEYRMTDSNWSKRLAIAKRMNPTKWFSGLGRGDIANAQTVNGFVANTQYTKPLTVAASGGQYILVKEGTSGASMLAGTGDGIISGTCVFSYLQPHPADSGRRASGVVFARIMKYHEQVQAALPGIPITMQLITTGATSSDGYATPGGQTLQSGFGDSGTKAGLVNGFIAAKHPLLKLAETIDARDVLQDGDTGLWKSNGTAWLMTPDGAHYNSYSAKLASAKVTAASFSK